MMRKILTVQEKKSIIRLYAADYFGKNKKGCHGGTRRTNDLQYKVQHILKKAKTRWENVAMVCIGFKKINDLVPQTWIIVVENVQNIRQNHKLHHESHGKLEGGIDSGRLITNRGKNPVKNNEAFFLGDSFFPLLFVIAMIQLIYVQTRYILLARFACMRWSRRSSLCVLTAVLNVAFFINGG